MPLLFPTSHDSTQTIDEVCASVPKDTSPERPFYLVFFASPSEATGGKSWCPDCTRVESTLAKCLPEDRSTLVYVGERDAWRAPANTFRNAFGLARIPTIIRLDSADHPNMAAAIEDAPRLWEGALLKKKDMKEVMGLDI